MESAPEAGAVRVEADADGGLTAVLAFSERLDPQASRAVQVAPAGLAPPVAEVRGRELRVRLDSLRPQTTYVLTVGTDLRDARRVPLAAPLTVAFSTGDRVDAGRLTGRVRTPAAGAGASGVAVWAYAVADSTAPLPDPRQRPPDYQTETGPDGAFALEYLREGAFFVAAVRDANRNRRADPGEAFAVPLRPLATADTVGGTPLALTLGLVDSLPPEPQRARGLSRSRLAVRFSEPVRLRTVDTDPWVVTDSTGGGRVPVAAAYVDPASPQEVRLRVARPLAPAQWQVALAQPGVAADSAGNGVGAFRLAAIIPDREDDERARVAGFLPERPRADSVTVLRPDEAPGVAFTVPPEAAPAITVTASGDTLGVEQFSADAREVRLRVPPEVRAFAVAVSAGDSTRERRYRRLAPRETGEITGAVAGGAGVTVEATPERGAPYRAVTAPDGRFRLAGLPPGPYRLRLIEDADGDGAWSPGRLAPYAPPERLAFATEPQTVRARFETDVGTLRLAPEAAPGAPAEAPGAPEPPEASGEAGG